MRNGSTGLERSPTNRQPTTLLRTLLVSQRDDRIERRRPPRGPDAEEQAHGRAEDERQQDRQGRDQGVPVRQLRQHDGAERAEQHADQASREAQHQRLHEELKHDVERSEEHTSELQSRENLVCRLLLEKKKKIKNKYKPN